jgi:hypothetical protein
VVEAFAGNITAAEGQRDEECVGPKIVAHVEAVIPRVLAEADKRSGVLTQAGGKHARPPRRKQQQGVESSPARRFDHWPAVEQSVILEPFDPSLGDTSTREEELLDLITIEVPIIGEGCKDGDISSGQSTNEFIGVLLGEALAGVGG